MKKSFLIFFVIISISNLSYSQSLKETLSSLSSDAATSYVEPIISAFGSNMNSGWVSGVPSASIFGLNLKLRVIVAGTFFPEDKRTFSTTGNFRYTREQATNILLTSGIDSSNSNYTAIMNEILNNEWSVDISGPTITGSDQENVIVVFKEREFQGINIGQDTTILDGVNGFLNDLPLLPTPTLQLDVGNVAGTSLSVRFFPGINVESLGKITLWGVGLIHNPSFWLASPLPVDIGAGFFYQKLDVGDIFQNTSFQVGAYLSKTFGVIVTFTPYAGITYETSNTTLNYTYRFDTPAGQQDVDVSFDLDGENNIGLTAGATLNLPVVSINIDYKLAKIGAITAGIGFGF